MESDKKRHERRCLEYFLEEAGLGGYQWRRLDGRWSGGRPWPDFVCFSSAGLFIIEITRLIAEPMAYEGIAKVAKSHIIQKLRPLPGVFRLEIPHDMGTRSLIKDSGQLAVEIGEVGPSLREGESRALSLPGLVLRKADAGGRDRVIPWITDAEQPSVLAANLEDLRANYIDNIQQCQKKFEGFDHVKRLLLLDCSRSGVWEPLVELPIHEWTTAVAPIPVDSIYILAGVRVDVVDAQTRNHRSVLKGHRYEDTFRYSVRMWP